MQNVRSYKKMIREAQVGETFYYNSIAGTTSMIDLTRELIKTGKIRPVREEIEKMIVPEAVEQYMDGTCIAPQMTYEVISK